MYNELYMSATRSAEAIKKSIVVIGAGFGGLRAAKRIAAGLRREHLGGRYAIYLIDRNGYHTYTPTLYEAATTSKETANYLELRDIVTFDVLSLIADFPEIIFLRDTVTALDLIRGDVHCSGMELKFDYLVLAMGSETNYFDIPGLAEYALPMKTFMDALTLRDRALSRYAAGGPMRVVIGGGGSAGVELAGELQEWFSELREEQRSGCAPTVTIVESAPTVLAGFASGIIARAMARLKKLGISLMLNERITGVTTDTVTLQNGKTVPFDILIWTGGVKTASLMNVLPLKHEAKNRVEVLGAMECLPQTEDLKLYGAIYGLGDAVCFFDPVTKKPVPLVARAALIQADIVAHNIIQRILVAEGLQQMPVFRHYRPMEYPYVIPLGGKYAIARIGPFVLSGFFAWVFKGLIELMYLSSILPFGRAIKTWLKGLRIFLENDRLG